MVDGEHNDGRLVQIVKHRVEIKRVPRGKDPVIEMHLESHQRVVQIRDRWSSDYSDRKTVDHVFDVWIESTLS